MHPFLSQTAEYALRAMAWIAARSPDRPLLARDVSVETRIPAQYLSKILRRLVLAGVLESRKGRGGGFMLTRPPERISFRDVLVAVDAFPAEDRCAFGWGTCNPARPCPLHESWGGMEGAFREWAAGSHFGELNGWPTFRASRRPVAAPSKRPAADPAGRSPATSPARRRKR